MFILIDRVTMKTLLIYKTVLVALVSCVLGSAAAAQSLPTLPTSVGFTLTRPGGLSVTARSLVAVSRRGLAAIGNQGEARIAIIAADGSERGTARIGGSNGNMGEPHFGWVEDTLWVTWGTQIVLFDSTGKAVRNISRLMTIHGPDSSTTLRVSEFGGFEGPPPVVAVLPGGGLILQVLGMPGLTPPELGAQAILALSETGDFRALLGWNILASTQCDFAGLRLPLCSSPLPQWSRGGEAQLVAVSLTPPLASARFMVTRTTLSGAAVERSYAGEPMPATEAEIDSASKLLLARGSQGSPPLPAALVDSVLRHFRQASNAAWSPIIRILPASDGSVWLEMRRREPGHHWMVLSPDGEPLGRVSVPENTLLQAATADMALALVRGRGDAVTLVQLRVG